VRSRISPCPRSFSAHCVCRTHARPRCAPSVKHSAFLLIARCGPAGLAVAQIVSNATRERLYSWGACKTPNNSVTAALSQDVNFVRVAPSTYSLAATLRAVGAAAVRGAAAQRTAAIAAAAANGDPPPPEAEKLPSRSKGSGGSKAHRKHRQQLQLSRPAFSSLRQLIAGAPSSSGSGGFSGGAFGGGGGGEEMQSPKRASITTMGAPSSHTHALPEPNSDAHPAAPDFRSLTPSERFHPARRASSATLYPPPSPPSPEERGGDACPTSTLRRPGGAGKAAPTEAQARALQWRREASVGRRRALAVEGAAAGAGLPSWVASSYLSEKEAAQPGSSSGSLISARAVAAF